MKDDFKKIAMGLGVVIPACLLTLGTANAAETKQNVSSESQTVRIKMDKGNDVYTHLLASVTKNSNNRFAPDHTDYHTDMGGNHTNSHSNSAHSNTHVNRTSNRDNQCVHTDSHTNKEPYNRHTNSGNSHHTDRHTNLDRC